MAEKILEKKVKYNLNDKGEFIIENYNYAKPMANFFPGIAGKYGIPMWVFYVNRGQAINSFGTDGKDHAILEFQPANKAWQQTSLLGFRTFIKLCDGKKECFYEPFHNGLSSLTYDLQNQMSLTSYDLKLEETNKTLGLSTKVRYFTIPQDNFAGLVRVVTIKNTSKKSRKIQLLDGLPRIVPYGIANLFLKKLSRTIEAWMRVENLDKSVPFYKVNVDPIDRAQVVHIQGGNFFIGFHCQGKTAKIIKPIVDPEYIFGPINDFSFPRRFLSTDKFRYPLKQQTQSKTPCGFILLDLELEPGQEKSFYSVTGNAANLELLNSSVVKKLTRSGYLEEKENENRRLIEEIQSDVKTKSSSWQFDYYCKQTYLDNVMRGGYPLVFKTGESRSVFYLYSRKHGDLERDYNKFEIQPTYFSQGNGNYRDMNQNRRCDVWFNPEIEDFNIIVFLNLLQTDGFNPLVVKGSTFSLKDVSGFKNALAGKTNEADLGKIIQLLEKPYTPGKLIIFLEENKIKLSLDHDEFLKLVLSFSVNNPEADHGEGFWTDHWHYNLDLLESFLGIYPEKLKEVVFVKKVYTFYDNAHVLVPREKKYILLDGLPKQLHATAIDEEKKKLISERKEQPHTLRTDYGRGEIYKTTLINKLFCLLVNKLSSLDPFGCGVEMEADKPNWFDSLNGLPALFGSSSCETFELKRLALFIQQMIKSSQLEKISLSEEISDFLFNLSELINQNLCANAPDKDFLFWDKSYTLRENYRARTRLGLSGREIEISSQDALSFLENAVRKINAGLEKAKDEKEALYYGYFINEVADYELLNNAYVKPKKFVQKRVPLFLEGQMHALRLTENAQSAKAIYSATKKSPLFDRKLKMYKVTAPLKSMPLEIGRCSAFTPGWLENESIWLHMEYKYLLEVLEHGLYAEFYQDFKNVLIPFQKPEAYGRSILENSSFIVSSAFPYPELHGNGFVARLSGSTVEFLQLWLHINAGKKPFFLNEKNELNLKFSPCLPGWLFSSKEKTYSFRFLSTIPIVYHNPKGLNTFGKGGASVKKIILVRDNGKTTEIAQDTLNSVYALEVRQRRVKSIDIYLE
jgi:hypothetical protein